MKLQLWTALAVALRLATADEDWYGIKGSNNATGTPTAKEGRRTIHYVTVGKVEHQFQPNSIVAEVGDIVSFSFYPTNHSVIQAKYGYPCIPIQAVDHDADQFYSEFFPVNTASAANAPVWNLTINSTEPIFYYCGATGSCTDWGMVGAINANGSMSIATQIELAHEADYMLLPGQQFPSEAVQASLSALAHSATTTTEVITTTTSAPKSSSGASTATNDGSSGISTGAVAGIAVGAAVVALAVAALFFLMRRTKKLKRRLELKTAASHMPPTWEQPGSPAPAAAYAGSYYDPNRPTSQLPPYRPYHNMDRPDMSKGGPRTESWALDSSGHPMMTPVHSDGYHSPAMAPSMQHQWSMSGNGDPRPISPAAELESQPQEMAERRS